MKRNLFYLHILCAVLCLTACGGHKTASSSNDQEGDTLVMRHAKNLTVIHYDHYTAVKLRNPWDTLKTLHTYILVDKNSPEPSSLPEGTIVRIPVEKALIYSSVHCGLFDELGIADHIAGICDLQYIKLEKVRKACLEGRVADCGNGMNPNIERIIDLHPDALLISPFENSGGYGRVEKLDIPIIECADYMESSPLGRAEWMRFYGLLTGTASQADSLFNQVEQTYLSLSRLAQNEPDRPTVLGELKNGAAWYVPGGQSTTGQLFGCRQPLCFRLPETEWFRPAVIRNRIQQRRACRLLVHQIQPGHRQDLQRTPARLCTIQSFRCFQEPAHFRMQHQSGPVL